MRRWNDIEEEPDIDYRAVEEQVEMRLHTKRMVDCELPEGFTLVTPSPRQYWLEQQLRWAFELEFRSRFGHVTYRHVARYIQQVNDETQLRWAVDEFKGELEGAGVKLENALVLMPKAKVITTIRMAC